MVSPLARCLFGILQVGPRDRNPQPFSNSWHVEHCTHQHKKNIVYLIRLCPYIRREGKSGHTKPAQERQQDDNNNKNMEI